MDLGLQGMKVLVTGSSRGLGFATARQFALEGASVVINSRHPDQLSAAAVQIAEETRGSVRSIPADLQSAAEPARLVETAAALLGGLDILVSNAGGPPTGSFENTSDDAWLAAFNLTFMTHVRLARAGLPYLKTSAAPAILTITSYSAKQPIPNLVLSNALRAGVLGLTKSLALELGSNAIRVNSILPAWTETERVLELMTARAKINQTSIEEEIKKQARESVTGRMARPDEFAAPAVFLCSPRASYITGTMLSIDGGMYKGTL